MLYVKILSRLENLKYSLLVLSLILIIPFTLLPIISSPHFPIISNAWAATYYVNATNGNDSNNGTSESTPWKTIAKVNGSRFNPRDQILFKKGEIWREQLTVPSSGTAGASITFGAYGSGDAPIINGANIIIQWNNYSGNIWQAQMATKPTQIFFNGRRGNVKDSFQSMQLEYDWYWSSNMIYVFSINNPDLTYSYPGIEASVRDKCITIQNKDYIVIDSIDCKYAYNVNIYLISSNYCVLKNLTSSFAHYDGISLGFLSPSNNLIDNCVTHHNGHFDAQQAQALGGGILLHDGATNSIVQNCISYENAEDGIGLGGVKDAFVGANNIVQNNECYNNHESGIDIKNGPQIIRNNIFRDNIGDYDEGMGIMIGWDANGLRIYSNKVYNNKGGIYTADNNTGGGHDISYNLIYNNTYTGIDLKGGAKSLFTYNIVYGNSQYGIFVESNAAQGCNFYNNTVVDNYGYQLIAKAQNTSVKNNILQGHTAIAFFDDGLNNPASNFNDVLGDNYRWGKDYYGSFVAYQIASANDVNSINEDPQFVDASAYNYNLKTSSRCIGAGANLRLARDYAGTPLPAGKNPDIGALEFTAPRMGPPKNVRVLQP